MAYFMGFINPKSLFWLVFYFLVVVLFPFFAFMIIDYFGKTIVIMQVASVMLLLSLFTLVVMVVKAVSFLNEGDRYSAIVAVVLTTVAVVFFLLGVNSFLLL